MRLLFSLLIYNLLLPAALLGMLPGALAKMRRRGGHWQDLAQRLGFLPPDKRAALDALPPRRVWVHAVSVGEAGIAMKLIPALLARAPDLGVLLTTTTPTGHALAAEFATRHAGRVVVLYSPVDLPLIGAWPLRLARPEQIILVEAELWPNLAAAACLAGVRMSLVNARLSARSERRFRRFGFFIRPVFRLLDLVCVQEPGDRERFAGLGVREGRAHLTGSIKFDPQGAEADAAQVESLRAVMERCGIRGSRPVLLLASTHPGEEKMLAGMWLRLREKFGGLSLIIVPRHVERAAEILAELRLLGISARRRTTTDERMDAAEAPAPVLLVDTTGELRAWQCLATVVVVGKSFLAAGGQNPAEAVMAGKPVLFGPRMENFEPLVELLLRHEGALQVPDELELERQLGALLAAPEKCRRLGAAGFAALQAHAGATSKTVSLLLRE